MVSKAVAEVLKNCYKINRVHKFCDSFETLLAFWILLDKKNVSLSFFFKLKLNANVYHCLGKLHARSDAVGRMVNCWG